VVTGQPPVDPGAQAGGVPVVGNPRAWTRHQGGLEAQLEPLKQQLRFAVSAASAVNHEDAGTLEAALEQLSLACEDLRHQMRGNAAAEGVPEPTWMAQYEAETASATGAMVRVKASLKKRQGLKKVEAASRAANCSLETVDQDLHSMTLTKPWSFTTNWWSGGASSPPRHKRLTRRRVRTRWRCWTVRSAIWQPRGEVLSMTTPVGAHSRRGRASHHCRFGRKMLFSSHKWISRATTSPMRQWPACCRC
jgi:hypothetical protein